MKKFDFDLTVATNALNCPNPQAFYDKAYLDGEDANFMHIIPNVKTTTKIANTRFPSVLQALDCTFAATSNPLSATTVTVANLKSNVSLCKSTLITSFVVQEMRAGANNYTVESFMTYYWGELQKEISSELSVLRWQGDTAGTGATFTGDFAYKTLFDGFEKKLNADALVVDVTASAVTTGNVIAILAAVLNAAPTAIKLKKNGAVFYASTSVVTAFRIAAALGNTQAYITGDMELSFAGYRIVEAPGMTDGYIVFTRPENLVYAFDGSEEGDIVANDLMKSQGIPNILTTVLLAAGVQHVNGNEIVFFH